MALSYSVSQDTQSGGVIVSSSEHPAMPLHPLWLRERVTDPASLDTVNGQRLYEHFELAQDITVTSAQLENESLALLFSDGHSATLSLNTIARELGWEVDPESPPARESWTAASHSRTEASWHDLNDPQALKDLLAGFHRYGFCLIHDTPTDNKLTDVAEKFGYVRDQNFGKVFHVEMKPAASDAAYTDEALLAHTDNPYRDPVPGIQYLQCIANEVEGGFSTLVDGLAIAEQLGQENPDYLEVLKQTPVRFRYDGPAGIQENDAPLIDCHIDGRIRHIRLSSRVDYVPALDPETLSLFYAARKRLHELSNDPAFQISFPFTPGLLLMMDNKTVLHGRTAFDGARGHRYLQGCYIDHDGPNGLYRMLARDGKTLSVMRES